MPTLEKEEKKKKEEEEQEAEEKKKKKKKKKEEEQEQEEEEEEEQENCKVLLQQDGTPPHFVVPFRHPFIESFHLMDWQRWSLPGPHVSPYCIPVDFGLLFWGI